MWERFSSTFYSSKLYFCKTESTWVYQSCIWLRLSQLCRNGCRRWYEKQTVQPKDRVFLGCSALAELHRTECGWWEHDHRFPSERVSIQCLLDMSTEGTAGVCSCLSVTSLGNWLLVFFFFPFPFSSLTWINFFFGIKVILFFYKLRTSSPSKCHV